jgi:hypothetical protein
VPEKKPAEGGRGEAAGPAGSWAEEGSPFVAIGGRAQQRYEALRAYMLLPRDRRSRASAARFELSRFERFGLLGLLERDPVGEAWRADRVGTFHVEMIPVGTADTADRRTRLYQFLYQLATGVTGPAGGEDASRSTVRSRLDRDAGEGANDQEPARRGYAAR